MKIISQLSEEQKIAFLAAFAKLAAADGKIDEEEKIFIKDAALTYGLPEKRVEEIWKNSMDQALRNTKVWVKKELFLCLMSLEHNDTAIGSNNYAISIGTNSSTIGRMLNQIILEIYKKESFRKVYLIFKVKEGINYKTGPLIDLLEQVIECIHENKNIRHNPFGFCARRWNWAVCLSEERSQRRRIHCCGNFVFGRAEKGSRWCGNSSNRC